MDLYDWLLALHLIAAFGLVASVIASWTNVAAAGKGIIQPAEAGRYGGFAGPMTGVWGLLTIVFGVWLVFEVDGYDLLDFWIIGAIVLWFVAMALGPQAGKAFQQGPAGRQKGIMLLSINSVLVVLILILMIWKPGH